jgi:probable F420-dependent oxidoreductase
MNIGLFFPLANPIATPAFLRALGEAAETAGFHSLWAPEHVVLFDEYASQYPYADDGRIPMGGEVGMLEPFGTLSFLAAVTSRIRLGTGICLVPQRNPVYTAKEVTNLDWLSEGRVDFGIGVGWLAEEFRAVAAEFDRRGARCYSYIDVMKTLWCDEISEFKDEFYELPACRQYPKPIQTPHPPLYFGGESDAALRRVARVGQGWYGFNLEPDEFASRLKRLDELLEQNGRKRNEIDVSLSPYLKGCDLDKVKRYREAGADQVILFAAARDEGRMHATIEDLAESIVEPARGL